MYDTLILDFSVLSYITLRQFSKWLRFVEEYATHIHYQDRRWRQDVPPKCC